MDRFAALVTNHPCFVDTFNQILIEPVCFPQVSGPSEVCPGSAATLVISDMKGFGRGRADIVWSHEG